MHRSTTTAALALAGAALAAPSASALEATDPPSPHRTALRAPLAGHVTVASHMAAARRENLRADLIPRVLRQARDVARVKGDEDFSGPRRRRALEDDVPRELRERLRELRREERRARREKAQERRERAAARAADAEAAAVEAAAVPAAAESPAAPAAPSSSGGSTASAPLEAIAACESGGDPSAVGGGGAYGGKYQFSQSTWESVGGTGSPTAASEAEQDARAAQLYAREGASPWPTCGR